MLENPFAEDEDLVDASATVAVALGTAEAVAETRDIDSAVRTSVVAYSFPDLLASGSMEVLDSTVGALFELRSSNWLAVAAIVRVRVVEYSALQMPSSE